MMILVSQAAKILEISKRAVRKRVNSGIIEGVHVPGVGRGGCQLRIILESLPSEAQQRYAEQNGIPAPTAPDTLDYMSKYSGKQRKEAEFKLGMIRAYRSEKHQQGGKLTITQFLRAFNQVSERKVTAGQMYAWIERYNKSGVEALIDTRGGRNKGQSTITKEQWDFFSSLYLTQQKLSISRCHQILKKQFPDAPSVSAFERKARTIPEYARIKYREGETAFRDNLPYMERDKSALHSNDVWDSDHHLLDVFVRGRDGLPVRLWFTSFVDFKSTKIVSWLAYEAEPCASVIKRCLRDGIARNGVPETIYTDNGKDYTSKALNEPTPFSILHTLNIETIRATPYHGQAKPVERFHRTLEEDFCKMFPTYAGKDAKNRPESMQLTNRQLAKSEDLPTVEEFIKYLGAFVDEYNARSSSGLGMDGKSPDQIYAEGFQGKARRTVTDQNILNLFCCHWEKRKVQRNGVQILNNFYYDSEGFRLGDYYKQTVWVAWDPENIDSVLIFSTEEKFLCRAIARCRPMQGHTTEEEYRAHKKEVKRYREAVRKWKPAPRDHNNTIVSYYDAAAQVEPDQPAEKTSEQIISQYSEAARAFEENAPAPRRSNIYLAVYDHFEKEDETCQLTASKKHKLA